MQKAIIIASIIAYSSFSFAQGTPALPQTPTSASRALKTQNKGSQACDTALKACDDLVAAQDEAITRLKQNVQKLEDEAAKGSDNNSFPLVILSFVAGIALGVLVGVH